LKLRLLRSILSGNRGVLGFGLSVLLVFLVLFVLLELDVIAMRGGFLSDWYGHCRLGGWSTCRVVLCCFVVHVFELINS
jgi:hypothetical protein